MKYADEKMIDAGRETPYYLFDIEALKKRIKWIRSLLGEEIRLCYSVKANPWVLSYVSDAVDLFEACSPGELSVCKRQGIPEQKIVFGGVMKDAEAFRRIAGGSAGTVSVESLRQLNMLQEWMQRAGRTQRILLRLSGGNQFGMEEKEIREIAARRGDWPDLIVDGIHFYSGTQKIKEKIILEELKNLEELADCLGLKTIEYGPGIGFPYFVSDPPYQKDFLASIASELKRVSRNHLIVTEMGRFLTSPAGMFVARVVDIKANNGRKYYILDGGRNHFTYLNQGYGIKTPFYSVIHLKERVREMEKVTVCGPLCAAGDILIRNVLLEACDVGDVFVFKNTGAYSSTECMALFLQHQYPAIYAYHDGHTTELRKREYLI